MERLSDEERRSRQNQRSKLWREKNKDKWTDYNSKRPPLNERLQNREKDRLKRLYAHTKEFNRLKNLPLCI